MIKKILLSFSFFFLCTTASYAEEETNSFIVCDNGLEMFHWDLDFIRQANERIEIAACFAGGSIIRELLTEVEARLEVCPELEVYILATPILLEKQDHAMIDRLKSTYKGRFNIEHAASVLTIWPDVTGIDNHVKMLVVDETYFSAGGTNLDQSLCSEGTYTPPRNTNKGPPMGGSLPAGVRDQDIVGRGPFAKEMRILFHKLYAIWENYNVTGKLQKNPEEFADNSHFKELDLSIRPFVERFETSDRLIDLNRGEFKLISGGPHQKNNAITNEYVKLINGAKEEIRIANLYFSPVDPIFNALLAAANRGVKLRIITNGTGDVPPEYTKYFCWANRMCYVPMFYGRSFHFWDVLAASKKSVKDTRIYEYHVRDILLHKKMMLVDNKKFVVGSFNLGTKSDLSDYELILVFDSVKMGAEVKKVFDRDLQHSREISPKEAREWYFDPITSYMGEVQKRFHGLI